MIVNPNKIRNKGVVKNLAGRSYEIQQNGIDLTLGSVELVEGGFLGVKINRIEGYTPLTPDEEGYFDIEAGKSYSIMFEQEVDVPINMCAQIIQRSTLNRMGAFVIAGLYDSGFKNQIGAILRSTNNIRIEKGARVAQIIFMEAESASMYDGAYQGYY